MRLLSLPPRREGVLRRVLMRAIVWPGTSLILSLAIIVNSGALMAFDPITRESPRNTGIFWITVTTSVIFTLELVAKIIAFGFNGAGGFLRDPWNWLDVLIVFLGYAEFSKTLSHVSGVRILRLVRPLQAFAGVRVVLDAFLKALPGTPAQQRGRSPSPLTRPLSPRRHGERGRPRLSLLHPRRAGRRGALGGRHGRHVLLHRADERRPAVQPLPAGVQQLRPPVLRLRRRVHVDVR